MLQPLNRLRGAGHPASAAAYRFAIRANGRALANRALIRKDKGLDVGTLFHHHLQDLGDDIPRPLDAHHIADLNIFFQNVIFVMQGGVGDNNPANRHRFKPSHRR